MWISVFLISSSLHITAGNEGESYCLNLYVVMETSLLLKKNVEKNTNAFSIQSVHNHIKCC